MNGLDCNEEEPWEESTGFLPGDFETIQQRIRQDATVRFKRLGMLCRDWTALHCPGRF